MISIANKRAQTNDQTVGWADQEEVRSFLALSAIKGVGYKTLYAIADARKSFADVFHIEETDRAVNLLRSFGARVDGSLGVGWQAVRKQASERATHLIQFFLEHGSVLIFRNHKAFPHAFFDLENPPHWLFVRGNLDALCRPALAIVGTREPTDDGAFLARYVGSCLPYWGATTISGLASGIDQYVHEYSLRFKVPTIAILGTGILSDYPRGALDLKERIVASGGALVTEYLPSETYSAQNFVMRNRLQAALRVEFKERHRSYRPFCRCATTSNRLPENAGLG
jgi:DNA processing protein